jgi:hypothetical protein
MATAALRSRGWQLLQTHGKSALQPSTTSSGKHVKPRVSPRLAAKLRRDALKHGIPWTFGLRDDHKPFARNLRPKKGHKRERAAEARQALVTQGLQKAQELQQQAQQKRHREKLASLPVEDRLLLTKRQQRKRLRGFSK